MCLFEIYQNSTKLFVIEGGLGGHGQAWATTSQSSVIKTKFVVILTPHGVSLCQLLQTNMSKEKRSECTERLQTRGP